MSLNIFYQLFCLFLIGSTILIRYSKVEKHKWDSNAFVAFGVCIILFAVMRPLGISLDDLGYYNNSKNICPTIECGKIIQQSDTYQKSGFEFIWWSLLGVMKSWMNRPEAMLWLTGCALIGKLWIIKQLCNEKLLALTAYVTIFYLQNDITAFRVSMANTFYLLSIYFFINNQPRMSFISNIAGGFTHNQAFLGTIIGPISRSPLPRNWIWVATMLPLLLILLGLYPKHMILSRAIGSLIDFNEVMHLLPGDGYNFYLNQAGKGKIGIPVILPPTMALSTYLIYANSDKKKPLFNISTYSIIVSAWLLWIFADYEAIAFRLFQFFFIGFIFIAGNTNPTRINITIVIIISCAFIMKYSVLHQLIYDQRELRYIIKGKGHIITNPQGIECGHDCGLRFNQGSTIQLSASPEPGYRFDHWNESCVGRALDCKITLQTDKSVTAIFTPAYLLWVEQPEGGTITNQDNSINCGIQCRKIAEPNTLESLSAKPIEGFRFLEWSGDCQGSMPICNIIMTQKRSVEAIFIPDESMAK